MKYVQKTLTATLMLLCLAAARAAAGQEKVIHSFNGRDGAYPFGGLLIDAKGNLFGITEGAFDTGEGQTAFEVSPTAGGGWAAKVIYRFDLTDGDSAFPSGSLTSDGKGNLFGTTLYGGTYFGGAVFELSPAPGGNWSERILYSFPYSGGTSSYPNGGLILDAHGDLFGTTRFGGSGVPAICGGPGGCGTVFELTPANDGGWTEKFYTALALLTPTEMLQKPV